MTIESGNSKRTARATRVTLLGLFANVLLFIIKVIAGLLGKSSAIIADGIHSLSDSATDIVVIFGLKMADKPPDSDHRYGHGKIETLSAFFISLFLIAVGFSLIWEGSHKFYNIILGEIPPIPSWIVVGVAILSIAVKEYLYRKTLKRGEEIKSNAVIANAWHHRSDALSSIGVAIGVSCAILLGGKWIILDPITSVIVSIFIIISGISISKTSIGELLESSLSEDVETEIVEISLKVEKVINPHEIRTRRIGKDIAIDMHIEVDKNLTVEEAHAICDELEKALRSHFGKSTFINIHCEPTD